jgi:hypothetical protein
MTIGLMALMAKGVTEKDCRGAVRGKNLTHGATSGELEKQVTGVHLFPTLHDV